MGCVCYAGKPGSNTFRKRVPSWQTLNDSQDPENGGNTPLLNEMTKGGKSKTSKVIKKARQQGLKEEDLARYHYIYIYIHIHT